MGWNPDDGLCMSRNTTGLFDLEGNADHMNLVKNGPFQLVWVTEAPKIEAKKEHELLLARIKNAGRQAQVRTLLEEIDEADDNPEEMINRVFDSYALPGENVERGEGKKMLTRVVAEHVSRESKERASRLRIPILAYEPSQCEAFVEQCLDPDGDGNVTREEAKEGLAKALNDIDTPKEFQKRTFLLEAQREKF